MLRSFPVFMLLENRINQGRMGRGRLERSMPIESLTPLYLCHKDVVWARTTKWRHVDKCSIDLLVWEFWCVIFDWEFSRSFPQKIKFLCGGYFSTRCCCSKGKKRLRSFSALRSGSRAMHMGLPCSSNWVMLPFELHFFPAYLYSSQGLFIFSASLLKQLSFTLLIAQVKVVLPFKNLFVMSDLCFSCFCERFLSFAAWFQGPKTTKSLLWLGVWVNKT